jgi:signal transduction histidine kinase
MLTLVLTALGALARRHRATSNALERRQIAYVFLAIGGAVALSFLNLSPKLAFLAALSPVFFSSVISYGITRHQLLDLRILLRQGAVGAVLSTALAFMLALTLFVSTKVFAQEMALGGVISLFLSAVLFTALYEPLRRFSAKLLDRWLVIPQVDVSASLLEYSQLVGRHPRLEDFFDRACERLRTQHRLTHCMVLLPDRVGHQAVYASSPAHFTVEPVVVDAALMANLVASPLGVDADELSWVRRYERDAEPRSEGTEDGLRKLLDAMGCQALFALRSGDNRSLGLLALGAERSGNGFSAAERSFFGALATLLSGVLENALLQGQMRHADRLQSLGALAAGLAHELRNPLSSILVFVQMLPERFHEESFREKFQRVVQLELTKLNRLTEQLLQISRPGLRTTVALDLFEELERARQLVAYQFRRREVGLRLECAEGTWIKGSSDELGQVLLNLFLNALAVSPKATTVTVKVLPSQTDVEIRVEDEGPGIPAAQMPRLFEPFFSTKADGNGLGLATSLRIVESFGGTLRAENRAEGGACFVMRLPRAREAVRAEAAS